MFAIVIHYFYHDSWIAIRDRLVGVSDLLDIFITVSEDLEPHVAREAAIYFPSAEIFSVPNGGMDIWPFLSIVPTLYQRGYTHLCKVHTKSVREPISRVWHHWMLDSLIGDRETVRRVITELARDPSINVVGTAGLYLSASKSMYRNRELVEDLYLAIYGKKVSKQQDWGFFAGTMFWSRTDALLPLAGYVANRSEITETSCGDDGHLVHALERFFGLVAVENGGMVALLHRTSASFEKQVPVVHRNNDCITNLHINEVIRTHHSLSNDLGHLRRIIYLNEDIYWSRFLDSIDKSVDPLVHYNLIGGGILKELPFALRIGSFWQHAGRVAKLQSILRGYGSGRNVFAFIAKYGESADKLTRIFNHRGFVNFNKLISERALFDKEYYCSQMYPGYQLVIDPLVHYLRYGFRVGLSPSLGFDPLSHLLNNMEILDKGIEPLVHANLLYQDECML
jgi:hypothetical protein